MAGKRPMITTELRQHPLGSIPDPDVAEELAALDAESEQTAYDDSLEARDAVEAARAGMSIQDWRLLSEEMRERVMATGLPREQSGLVDVDEAALDPRRGKGYFDNLVRQLATEEDPRHYVLLADPPQEHLINGVKGWYHPGVSKVPRKMMAKKLRSGWRARPAYPFLPAPTEACPLTNAAVFGSQSAACPYKGMAGTDEIEMHMKFAHPVEYELREKMLTRQKDELQIEIQREQLRLARIQADAAERAAGKAA